jgi:hypothetical protein
MIVEQDRIDNNVEMRRCLSLRYFSVDDGVTAKRSWNLVRDGSYY